MHRHISLSIMICYIIQSSHINDHYSTSYAGVVHDHPTAWTSIHYHASSATSNIHYTTSSSFYKNDHQPSSYICTHHNSYSCIIRQRHPTYTIIIRHIRSEAILVPYPLASSITIRSIHHRSCIHHDRT